MTMIPLNGQTLPWPVLDATYHPALLGCGANQWYIDCGAKHIVHENLPSNTVDFCDMRAISYAPHFFTCSQRHALWSNGRPSIAHNTHLPRHSSNRAFIRLVCACCLLLCSISASFAWPRSCCDSRNACTSSRSTLTSSIPADVNTPVVNDVDSRLPAPSLRAVRSFSSSVVPAIARCNSVDGLQMSHASSSP